MGKVIRSYALDPYVAEYLDKQPDGRGKKYSRSARVSEAVYYYWMSLSEQTRTLRLYKMQMDRYREELMECRARRGLWNRLKRLLKKLRGEQ